MRPKWMCPECKTWQEHEQCAECFPCSEPCEYDGCDRHPDVARVPAVLEPAFFLSYRTNTMNKIWTPLIAGLLLYPACLLLSAKEMYWSALVVLVAQGICLGVAIYHTIKRFDR